MQRSKLLRHQKSRCDVLATKVPLRQFYHRAFCCCTNDHFRNATHVLGQFLNHFELIFLKTSMSNLLLWASERYAWISMDPKLR